MSRRIGLLGLSGVGKSTLIGRVHKRVPLMHLQASTLIKQEQARRTKLMDSSEALRLGAVLDNQALLIAAFRRESGATQLPIIFDGHSVIDGRNGLVPIPSAVFSELELDALCFLSAPPEVIAARRQADSGRVRPERSIDMLEEQQRIARDVAFQIAQDVDASFLDLTDDNIDRLLTLIC